MKLWKMQTHMRRYVISLQSHDTIRHLLLDFTNGTIIQHLLQFNHSWWHGLARVSNVQHLFYNVTGITMEEEPKKGLTLFGRDVSQIPCFRSSFMYGIGGGVGAGLLTFLATSRTTFSTHVGFGSFCCGTIAYWSWCRYQWSARRFEYAQLEQAMRKRAMYEGTDVEKELDLKSA